MNFWLVIWFLISAALLYFFGWTIFILFKQKKTWREYAKKNKLRYTPGGWQESPEISGSYKDYTVSLFTGEHLAKDIRGSRKLTAIEIQLSSKVPFEGGVASSGMVEFLKELAFKEEILPKHTKWKTSYIAASDSPYALQSYLTDERLEALFSLIKIKNAWVILVFRDNTALLRFDTPDPLDNQKKIQAILKRLRSAAEKLELARGEAGRLKEDMLRTTPRETSVHIKDEDIDLKMSTLQLEEGDEADFASPPQKKNKVKKDQSDT